MNGHAIRPPHGLSEVMEVINPKTEPILKSVSIYHDEILNEEPVVKKQVRSITYLPNDGDILTKTPICIFAVGSIIFSFHLLFS